MKGARLFLSTAVVLALGGGYAMSQIAYFQGRAPEYAKSVDTPGVRSACLAITLLAVGLALWRDRSDTP